MMFQKWSGKSQCLDFPKTALGLHSQVRAFCPFPMGSKAAFLSGTPSHFLLDVSVYYPLNGKLPTAAFLLGWKEKFRIFKVSGQQREV